MAIAVTKKIKVDSQFKMVKLQFILYCFLNDVNLSNADLDCLTHMAIKGFGNNILEEVVKNKVFKTTQTARNCRTKLTKLGLLVNDSEGRRLNPTLSIGIDNIILLDMKIGNVR